VSLGPVLQDLLSHLVRLRDEVEAFRVTLVEDKPERGDVALVDRFSDAADDLGGWLEEAVAGAGEARRASIGRSLDLDRLRQSVADCQERFNRSRSRLWEIASYDHVSELVRLGNDLGREGRAWVDSVRAALDSCRKSMEDVSDSLFLSWQELVERASISSVNVQATNIGQQISVPESKEVLQSGAP
jgi:hypothetical protein